MEIWIVWLPNVWKSTLFNALTKSYAADSANFPFCTIEPNIWTVEVKDARVDSLSALSWSEKTLYATINFVDIAWLVKWASAWEWLWNKFLATIREVDAIVQVVRHFSDDDVVHVEWSPNPLRDIEIINTELIIADMQMIENIMPWLQRKLKSWDADTKVLMGALEKIHEHLKAWWLAIDIKESFVAKELAVLKQYNFLTFKPFIYALNVAENDLKHASKLIEEYQHALQKPVCIVSAKFESEIMELEWEDRALFIEELQWDSSEPLPTLDDLIALAFDTVWLMYYFTTWVKETRAWTIPKWSIAPQAAWAIHTDFERWFIKADVVSYNEFIKAWWRSKTKELWVQRLEWKEYIVQDGDVMLFKFNV